MARTISIETAPHAFGLDVVSRRSRDFFLFLRCDLNKILLFHLGRECFGSFPIHISVRHVVSLNSPLLISLYPYRSTFTVIYKKSVTKGRKSILPNDLSTRGYTSILTIERFASLLLTLMLDVALLVFSLAEVTRVRAALMSTLLGRPLCESFLTGAALIPTFS